MKWTPYGPDAWLLQFAARLGEKAFHAGQAILADLDRSAPPGLVEYVPGFTTLLLEFTPGSDLARDPRSLSVRFEKALRRKLPAPKRHEIPVCYDGPDLERVARTHRLSEAEVCRRHAAPVYKVYLLGFSPGFPYLGDLDPKLHTPRLAAPRPKVPAGSVAIGGPHTGIYSIESPGGWNLIGRTEVLLFDRPAGHARGGAVNPFLLRPGDTVKFVPVPVPVRTPSQPQRRGAP